MTDQAFRIRAEDGTEVEGDMPFRYRGEIRPPRIPKMERGHNGWGCQGLPRKRQDISREDFDGRK
jgi:hypothetical protein